MTFLTNNRFPPLRKFTIYHALTFDMSRKVISKIFVKIDRVGIKLIKVIRPKLAP